MKNIKIALLVMLITAGISACKKDNTDQEPLKPTAANVEVGTSNNKRALRGRDFHFNADIVAAGKIKDVKLEISQKSGQSYTSTWKFELLWPEYAGTRNTNVHKHFTIPADAPEGTYDFTVIVTDENGSKLEIKEDLIILDPANLPVDPKIGRDFVSRNGTLIYYTGTFEEKELLFTKGDEMSLHAQVSEIKDDGVLYSLLIKKSINYYPENIDKLDLSKVIVVTKVEHTGLGNAAKISTLKLSNGVYGGESIVVGANLDNNEPSPSSISGVKAWESGKYNWVILYKNTTHNISVFKSIPITINY